MTGRFAILGLILAAQTLANVGPLGLPAIAKLIRDDLGLSLTQAGSFLSAYYVGPILMSLPAGTMADHWGVKRTLILGQLVIAGGLLAVSAAGSYAMLIALMICAGFGYGMLNPTSTKAVMAWFPPGRRATVIGLKQVGLPFGGALGATLMPALAVAVGWRFAVVVSAVIIVSTAAASLVIYRDPPDLPPPAPGVRTAFRAVLLTRDLWLVAIATLIFAAVQTVLLAFLVLYLTDVVALPLLVAGRYLAVTQVAGMAGRIVFGVLSDRTFAGRRRPSLAVAGIGSALGAILIALTGPGTSALALATIVFVFGFCGVGWNGVQHTLMAELAGARAAGTAVGLGLAVSSAGVTLGPPIFGWCVERVGSYGGPWIGLAALMMIALAVLIPIRERHRLA